MMSVLRKNGALWSQKTRETSHIRIDTSHIGLKMAKYEIRLFLELSRTENGDDFCWFQ